MNYTYNHNGFTITDLYLIFGLVLIAFLGGVAVAKKSNSQKNQSSNKKQKLVEVKEEVVYQEESYSHLMDMEFEEYIGEEEEEKEEEEDGSDGGDGDGGSTAVPSNDGDGSVYQQNIEYLPNGMRFTPEQMENIDFLKNNPFPKTSNSQGVKFKVPANYNTLSLHERIEIVFDTYFKEFLSQLHISTNEYQEHYKLVALRNRKQPPWYTRYTYFSLNDIKQYLAIFIYAGLVRTPNMEELWKKDDNISFYNHSVFNILSFSKFKAIHRCLHYKGFGTIDKDGKLTSTDFQPIVDAVNDIFKANWTPGDTFSFDDDLYKWTGKGGSKKIIAGKADSVGNILWKLVDSFTYIYHFELEHYVKNIIKSQNIPVNLNQEILKRTEEALDKHLGCPVNFGTCIIIDAGILGSMDNIKHLQSKGYSFIVSVAKNKCKEVMDQIIPSRKGGNRKKNDFSTEGEMSFGSNKFHTAIAWQAKKDKTVFFFTNIPKPICQDKTHELRRVSRTKKTVKGEVTYTTKQLTTPRVVWVYNNCHNYVDSTKMIINPLRNIHRARTYSRVVLNDIFYAILYNSFVAFQSLEHNCTSSSTSEKENSLRFKNYLLEVVNKILLKNPSIERNTRYTIVTPDLIDIEGGQEYCFYCLNNVNTNYKEKRTKQKCFCHNIALHKDCNMYFHNPLFKFNNLKHI
ncbi:hypothetical protein PPL_11147 [Heterostelium album PN500]|uniref:PiggyBac transposable element-derived protein domain-containing protein n=1 Tax=Heterostelium pallidum (strain ATCC 26659 / Pp 5 / PN500) TaxID=670386 RepID=D3BTN7_HETP5|nr:hypothetical protein PPL_11147 [Heterostelium album PN500]EFA75073.1 hypothetical protein PPL_11147 [Heterostelium album PN500]|eukprot:XP_020427207.1 hypothetical protein PPL_11147 [Heterostelium album PN500]